jgi:hypothetical protein
MVHEGGHCIGLGHTNNLYNIMGDERTHVNRNSTTTYYGPGEDASDGLIDLHGERSGGADSYRDVGVTTWRYDYANGEYSAHKMGRLLNSGGTELPKTGQQWEGQDEYRINAGDDFQMEATFENNGEMGTEYPLVSYYLSTNSVISILDTLLHATGYTLGRNTPFENTQAGLIIPVDTPAGDYFVGVMVDSDNTIPETTDRNNIAHYPIVIPPPDLTVTAPSVSDTTPTNTQTITGYATINNVGGAQSAATTLRYVRSTNSTISSSDTQVGSDAQGIINPGASIVRSEPFIFSATPGTYWYGACVDAVAGETVTTNQCSTGVQVTVYDVEPPTPNPMTFLVYPHELDTHQIVMTATTATDPGGGVQYYFDFTSSPTGGPGGSDSGWIDDSGFRDYGLGPNQEYCYRVYARDASGNTTSPSAIDCDYTLANQPVLGSFSNITETSIQVNLGEDGNPAGTEYGFSNATTGQGRSWSTSKTWVNIGLSCGTTYAFQAVSRNGDHTYEAWVELGTASTLPCPDTTPPTPNPLTFSILPHELNSSQIAMTATTASDPSGGIQYFFDFTSSPSGGPGGSDSGWIAGTAYTDSGLGPNQNYCYRVSARDIHGNQTGYSAEDCDYTLANQPVLGSFSNITETSIQVNLGADGNPAGTEYGFVNATTGQFQPWSTSKTWVNTGLTCGTTYTYGAWSKNGDGTNADEVVLGTASTLPCPDTDGDGVPDATDNCILEPNGPLIRDAGGNVQRDTDGDGYGNLCDGDLNNDGATNTLDLNLYKLAHRTAEGDANYNVDADFNGDSLINTLDLNIYKGLHRLPPGPSCCGAL